MRTNQLIVNAARASYIKHAGRSHRQIEREMHLLGCRRFSRRSLYNQRTKTGIRLGWIERYHWKDALRQNVEAITNVQVPALPSIPSSSSLLTSSSRLGVSASATPPAFPSLPSSSS